jgi:hypothetical protein
MANISLADFISEHRDELIGLCRAKVAARSSPPPTAADIEQGIPVLLTQLTEELRCGVPRTGEITDSARAHGRDLLLRGFTIEQVVHNYGDVCQAVTELAGETNIAISAEEFHTLNKCLDVAIAGAVTEYTREQDSTRDADLSELWSLVNSATVAFEALESGKVAVAGATGMVLRRALTGLRAYVDRQEVNAARAAGAAAVAPVAPVVPNRTG